jgi:DDE family transposase
VAVPGALEDQQWWQEVRLLYLGVKTLAIDLDNGPENHGRRTRSLERIVEFARKSGPRVHLAYYPPYHSKYNPIERCWGALENHWSGSLLDSVAAVVGLAELDFPTNGERSEKSVSST